MSVPDWALTVTYLLHMIATVVWVGGLAAMIIMIVPINRKYMKTLDDVRMQISLFRRLDILGWFSLLVLIGTGMLQMGASPNYQGFLDVGSRWSLAIFLKHLVFILMILLSFYISLSLSPKLQRSVLRLSKMRDSNSEENSEIDIDLPTHYINRATMLLTLNLIMGIVILGFTAIARVS